MRTHGCGGGGSTCARAVGGPTCADGNVNLIIGRHWQRHASGGKPVKTVYVDFIKQ